jgi:hypothetical protein
VRARAYFRRPPRDDDDETENGSKQSDDGRRMLQFMKNQYGPPGSVIDLEWHEGLWLPALIKQADQIDVENLFMDLLRRGIEQNRRVSASKSPTYAPSRFAEQPEARAARISVRAFTAAMERLFAMNRIKIMEEGPPSRIRRWIVEV